MVLRDAIDVSFDNLRQSLLRTILTTLGVCIGVGSLVVMLAIAAGLQENLYSKLLKIGFFRRVTVFPQFGRDQQPARQLDESALTAIRQIPGVKSVTQDLRFPVKLENGAKSASVTASAVTADDADEAVFSEMKWGRFFTAEDSREVILTSQAARNLGFANPGDAAGKNIRVTANLPFGRGGLGSALELPKPEPVELRVAGVVERERAVFAANPGLQAYVPQKLAEQQMDFYRQQMPFLAAMGAVFPFQVRLQDARQLERVEKQIRDLGFRTISISSVIANMRRAFVVVDLLLALIGSVALAVASLGIMNTMVMAVLERTREIGVMKAVGAEDRDIRRIFLTECTVIGGLGGAAGLLLAWVLGRLMNYGANVYIAREGYPPESLFHIPAWLILAAMGFALLVSIASGLYPAARAARIDPARALRHD